MNILIVEGDFCCAQSIGEIIERWGHKVERSGSGYEALRRIKESPFDLVLLDIFLPDVEGYELISQFKKLCPDIGIVTMTGYNSRELELQVRQQGILYYMIKPFETQHLRSLLAHISQKRLQQVTHQEKGGD
jgi:DNA-binding NtrC family response regulator